MFPCLWQGNISIYFSRTGTAILSEAETVLASKKHYYGTHLSKPGFKALLTWIGTEILAGLSAFP